MRMLMLMSRVDAVHYPVARIPSVLGWRVTVRTFSQVRPNGLTIRGELATSSDIGRYT